jgi:hypothetical protein
LLLVVAVAVRRGGEGRGGRRGGSHVGGGGGRGLGFRRPDGGFRSETMGESSRREGTLEGGIRLEPAFEGCGTRTCGRVTCRGLLDGSQTFLSVAF